MFVTVIVAMIFCRSGASVFTVQSGSCSALTWTGLQCVQSPNYPAQYDSSDCVIAIGETATISAVDFRTEWSYDRLVVNGNSYSGTGSGPVNIFVTSSSSDISWISDSTVFYNGWRLCNCVYSSCPGVTPSPTPMPNNYDDWYNYNADDFYDDVGDATGIILTSVLIPIFFVVALIFGCRMKFRAAAQNQVGPESGQLQAATRALQRPVFVMAPPQPQVVPMAPLQPPVPVVYVAKVLSTEEASSEPFVVMATVVNDESCGM